MQVGSRSEFSKPDPYIRIRVTQKDRIRPNPDLDPQHGFEGFQLQGTWSPCTVVLTFKNSFYLSLTFVLYPNLFLFIYLISWSSVLHNPSLSRPHLSTYISYQPSISILFFPFFFTAFVPNFFSLAVFFFTFPFFPHFGFFAEYTVMFHERCFKIQN